MAYTKRLTFFIYLTDADLVRSLNAQYPNGVIRGPLPAALEFDAPYQYPTTPLTYPSTRTDGWTPEWGFALDTGKYPLNNAYFTLCGSWWGFGLNCVKHVWVGRFVYRAGLQTVPPPTAPGDPPQPTLGLMGQRKFIDGFAFHHGGDSGEGNYNDVSTRISRCAGRFPESFGHAFRSDATQEPVYDNHLADELGVALSPDVWERFYVRLLRAPTSDADIWTLNNNVTTPLSGLTLHVNTSGALVLNGLSHPGTKTQLGVSTPLPVGTWVRVDILAVMKFNAPNLLIAARLYLNQTPQSAADWQYTTVTSAPATHAKSALAGWDVTSDGLELDLTDWVSIKPAVAHSQSPLATVQPSGPDWNHGSRMVVARPVVYDATMSGWTGDVRILTGGGQQPTEYVSSSTALAPLAVVTDADRAWPMVPGTLGVAAFIVGGYINQLVAGTGRLGWAKNGGAAQYVTQTGTNAAWNNVGYVPIGLAEPETITDLVIIHEKANNANEARVHGLFAEAELIGTFGPEDVDPDATQGADPEFLPEGSIHNAPYPRTPWAQPAPRTGALTGSGPDSPVFAKAGTYVGNGTAQDLTFPVPIHFFQTRKADSAAGTIRWFSSMMYDHENGTDDTPAINAPIVARMDPTYVSPGGPTDPEMRCLLSIQGNDPNSNESGQTYQYIAYGDPGSRHCLNGAVRVDPTLGDGQEWALHWPTWDADAGFFWSERNTVLAPGVMYKGPGHGATAASQLDAAEQDPAAEFILGGFKTSSPLHPGTTHQQLAYSLWRILSGTPDSTDVPVQIVSYTGDGAASRTIALTPASGRRPMFALVVPHNGASYFRDPGMTTNRSYALDNTVVTTAITAGGVDTITVGSTLNANGIIYDVFVLPGCSDAGGNGGWSVQCEQFYQPVPAPDYPGGFTQTEIDDAETPPDPGDGGDPGSGDGDTPDLPDLDDDLEACPVETLAIVNLALARIGVTQGVTEAELTTPTTPEATAVRLVYDISLQATLRDRAWPFATRYANLVLSAGSAVTALNRDWQYAYTIPDNCVFARRLVTERGPAVNPTPPPLYVGGGVLFTNEADAQLEYTARPLCPAIRGDATFRSAWAWRMAHELAPALSRIENRAEHCWAQYEAGLKIADLFIRLGKPGVRPVEDDYGPDIACPAAKLQVINLALTRIGGRTVADLVTEQSREAVTMRLIYEDELRATLRDFDWPFATAYANPLTLVDGDTDAYAAPDWIYSYRVPSDCVKARRLVKDLQTRGIGRSFDPDPITFRIGRDATGPLIYTNEADAVLEYTCRPDCAVEHGDSLFRDAFAWRLAAQGAPSLGVQDPDVEEQTGRTPTPQVPFQSEGGKLRRHQGRASVATFCWAMYQRAIRLAAAMAANEQQQEPHGQADWIRARE